MKNLGKAKNFRAATITNSKKLLPNLGEDLFLFFLEILLILGRKFKKITLIPRKNFLFRVHHN